MILPSFLFFFFSNTFFQVPLDRSLPMDGQCAEITVPSVGSIKVRVIASNYCHLKGLHGIPVLGLGVLPWDEKPLERREVVSETSE